ncbi:MAG: neutral/alkaline non-lysosomal ceramidase N-terminal domain-containing protein [Planctomyces sp.]
MMAAFRRPVVSAVVLMICIAFSAAATADGPWKAGTGRAVITPDGPIWMAGYASRTAPSEGHVHDLFTKSLYLQDSAGHQFLIVTLDLIAVPVDLREWLVAELQERHRIPAESLLINASHTHCGPEFRSSRLKLYGVPEDQQPRCIEYETELKKRILQSIDDAVRSAEPAELFYTHARCGFAMNRRQPTASEPVNAPYPDGAVDHDVPILKVQASDDQQMLALLFGYACHNTTLSFQKICGDYAGFAQADLEMQFPGTTALFLTGCGGDQNPQPRGTLELAEHHGSTLANSVRAGLSGPLRSLKGPLLSTKDSIPLALMPAGPEQFENLMKSSNAWFRRRGELLRDEWNQTGKVRTEYPVIVQTAFLGNDLVLVAVAGEVVVDYSIRLKKEIALGNEPHRAVWVAGYSHDVFGYLPSERVLREGGYEGRSAMDYSHLPAPFAPGLEEKIIDGVREQVRRLSSAVR